MQHVPNLIQEDAALLGRLATLSGSGEKLTDNSPAEAGLEQMPGQQQPVAADSGALAGVTEVEEGGTGAVGKVRIRAQMESGASLHVFCSATNLLMGVTELSGACPCYLLPPSITSIHLLVPSMPSSWRHQLVSSP